MRRRHAIIAIALGTAAWIALAFEVPLAPDTDALTKPGFGEIHLSARDGRILRALVYRATGFEPGGGPILFVMHGASRDVERYVRTAAPVAERNDALAIAIHFSEAAYPDSADYTLGETHSEIERAFDTVRDRIGGHQGGYYLFGHSAGAQFTHRLMTFVPEPRVLRAVAANAGWYTLPLDGPDPNHTMPYGLTGTPISPVKLGHFFAARFTVLLGERDIRTPAADSSVRGTPEAMAQGAHRLARGQYYFVAAEAAARELGLPFEWRLGIVPRAGHDAAEMMGSAAHFLFGPDEAPCAPTSADEASLIITEVLADPPDGEHGDANGDGQRHPSDDEFVEIVNAGAAPVCLSGWTVGDAENSARHVFPLGVPLGAGEAVVVFGGGLPTGDFGGARVEHAAFGGRLSLQNEGDVVTLRDAAGTVAARFSWGDCAGAGCAREHSSLTGASFSPGVRADGSAWAGEHWMKE